MTITDISNLFLFAGGLGMFLYGMHSMSGGIQKTTGNKMKELLGILTSNHFMAVIVGALVTAIIQSSGATTVMVVGFVNAGIMTLTQAVGVIMGANIGTCITAWIVSLGQLGDAFQAISPSLYAPLLLGIGAFLITFSKKAKRQTIGEILVGLGLLFIGLDFMGDAAGAYLHLPIFARAFELFGSNPVLGILIGVIVTAIMQSSSASVGVLQTLAAAGGVVTASSAMYISLGSNIGSCCTALLSSLGESRNAKRAAVIHLTFNILGTVLWGSGLFLFFRLYPALGNRGIDSVGISVFHTVFNIVCTVLMTPLRGRLVTLSGILVKGSDQVQEQSDDEITLRHLDDRILETPSFAVQNAVLEVVHMGHITKENMEHAFDVVLHHDTRKIAEVYRTEKIINKMEKLITEYLVKISNLPLNEEQHLIVNDLFYSVSDIERVGDHVENIVELIETKSTDRAIHFSEEGSHDMQKIMELVMNSFVYAVDAREKDSMDSAGKVAKYEDMVDNLEEELREKHIERLSARLCDPANGVAFLDILSNLERISDHAYNLAEYVMSEQ